MPPNTAILGVGLIGGSIGLALREAGWPVTGWGPREATLRLAVERGAIGAHALVITAEEHDHTVAAVSHLPFVAAAALVRAVAGGLAGLAGTVASSGFRDTTRVAMASAGMHADICNFNASALAAEID